MSEAHVFNIPAGTPFARSLATRLLAEAESAPLALTRLRVLLPSRRACRTVRDAFLQQSAGKATLLPQLQPIGDVDEDELTLALAATEGSDALMALPPAMPPLRRQMLLAQTIMKIDRFDSTLEQALALAESLGRLMDEIHNEGLDPSRLSDIVDGFAEHWRITTEFLEILTEWWPSILAEQGFIDASDRRNRLLRLLATHWQDHPPPWPVIAAGSTGTIPAAGELLATIARLPQGRLVLPGLDLGMDDKSWDAIDDTHPQAPLKHLLGQIGCDRASVRIWDQGQPPPRVALATELMRPAATTELWSDLAKTPDKIRHALTRLERHDCDTPEEEARVIALAFRKALEGEGTATLVTPDRFLARRVASICRRWGLEIDDTAGQPLANTEIGVYLRLIAHCACGKASPGALLSVLRHRLCRLGMTHVTLEAQVSLMEKQVLRGPAPPPGFDGLRQRARQRAAETTRDLNPVLALIDRIESAFATLNALCDGTRHPFPVWLEQHLKAAETLAADDAGDMRLWQGEAAEEASRFFATLNDHAPLLPPSDAGDYLAAISQMMRTVTVRPRYGTHPRLSILGQLESRLLQADTVILGGLNEQSWPPDAGYDPWMSRPMRQRFGLPSPEREIGISAHDFVQNFCSAHVILTRALRQGDAPTVPARWLQRLDTVIEAAGLDPDIIRASDTPWLSIARTMDLSAEQKPVQRPAPRPPVQRRPRVLPVTAISTWLQDPYALYARYVLGLRALDPLERRADSLARGNFIHTVLQRFVERFPDALPPDADQILIDIGYEHYRELADESGFWRYWLPRFERIARWIVAKERDWRVLAREPVLEKTGEVSFNAPAGPFRLTAKADRFDRLKAGGLAVIDYKTGGSNLTGAAIINGRSPQLPLEGLILQQGGFGPHYQGLVNYLAYWKVTGGAESGQEIIVDGARAQDAIDTARTGLEALIAAYDDETVPYYSLPDPARIQAFQNYAHLARVQEWSVAEDAEDGE